MLTSSLPHVGSTSRLLVAAMLWSALAISELLVISYLFDVARDVENYSDPVYYVTRTARWAIVCIPVFAILVWSRRHLLIDQLTAASKGHDVVRALAVNLVLFVLLGIACAAFSAYAAGLPATPWRLLPFVLVLLAATAVSLVGVALPISGLFRIGATWRKEALYAAVISFGMMLLSEVAISSWDRMAGTTLAVSAAILQLYETHVVVDELQRTILVGEFGVSIADTCSGFEGLALVTGFVSVYLWVFRRDLRFPQAFLLYPIGLASSWILNSVRIAALTSIGAHFSPEVAVKGFHSQAGWIAFLLVTLGLMALASRWKLLSARTETAPKSLPAAYNQTVSYLLPFVALMLGSIAMSTATPHDRPVYIVKVTLVTAALWLCRNAFAGWRLEVSAPAIAAGSLVALAWITTDVGSETGQSLGHWLLGIGPAWAAAWLIARGIGTIILVPVAEELAFRGYLYRRIIARDFWAVSPTHLSLMALCISSIVFGILHDRWIAAALAGVVFALLMLRSGRLSDAIVGHATANALIFAWALAFRQWSLL